MGQGQQELMGVDVNGSRGMVGGEVILRFLVGLTERMVNALRQDGDLGRKANWKGMIISLLVNRLNFRWLQA